MTAAVVRSVLEWCAEKHISCARLGTKLYCGAHQVQAADTKMYTMTSLPIRKSGEICAKKGMGPGVQASLPLLHCHLAQKPKHFQIPGNEATSGTGRSPVRHGRGFWLVGRGLAFMGVARPAGFCLPPVRWICPQYAEGAPAWAGRSAAPDRACSRAARAGMATATRPGHRCAGA